MIIMCAGRMEYQVKQKDLEKCFKFAVEYHLDERKGQSNRTTGQYRGLGGIVDNFFIGKLIEIGVASIIQESTKKKMILDFEIHEITKENVTDPDIVSIKERRKERTPKLYIEIKNVSLADRWIGLTAEQFRTILKNSVVKDDPSKLFIIYASLLSKNDGADGDLLGVYLKAKIGQKLLKRFCDSKDLYVKIQYILSGDELKSKGVSFREGSYMYETEIFQEVNAKTADKITNPENSHIYTMLRKGGNILPIIMRDRKPKPKEFGKFTYQGNLEIYTKKNPKSNRMYVYCKSNVRVKNKVLGIFNLKKGKVYECYFTTVGWNPTLKRNNVWIAQRNLTNVVPSDVSSRIQNIANKI